MAFDAARDCDMLDTGIRNLRRLGLVKTQAAAFLATLQEAHDDWASRFEADAAHAKVRKLLGITA